MLEFLSNDSLGRKAKAIAIERERLLQVGHAEGDDGDSWLHERFGALTSGPLIAIRSACASASGSSVPIRKRWPDRSLISTAFVPETLYSIPRGVIRMPQPSHQLLRVTSAPLTSASEYRLRQKPGPKWMQSSPSVISTVREEKSTAETRRRTATLRVTGSGLRGPRAKIPSAATSITISVR